MLEERCVGGAGAVCRQHWSGVLAALELCVGGAGAVCRRWRWSGVTYHPGQRWRENWASMAFCRTMVNLWKGNLAIASRSNSSRNSMTVPERCSCISSFGSPFSLVLDELMRVHLPAG